MERPRLIKSNPEISISQTPEDLQSLMTEGMEYTIQSYGNDSSKPTWTIDKYLIGLSSDKEVIEKGTTVVFVK